MSRHGVMLCQPFSRSRLAQWLESDTVAFAQPKFNGVRMRWTGARLLTSEGNDVVSLPHIKDLLLGHFHGLPLDGEAYCHGMSLQEIRARTARTKNIHPDFRSISYHIFDIPAPVSQYKRLEALSSKRPKIGHIEDIWWAPTVKVKDQDEVDKFLEEQVERGFEGIVLRKVDGLYTPLDINETAKKPIWMMKWKPVSHDIYEIVEVLEGTGKYKGSMGALIVRDKEGNTFHVGSFAIDDSERLRLWRTRLTLPGKRAKIRYFDLSESGKPPSSTFEVTVET